jgi:hypothetical protein
MNPHAVPTKSIAHPLWSLSLMVLLANDHLLKGAGVLPSWVTGKLSDLAGYFLFPSLLAVILRVQTRRGLILCHLATVALLLLTELSPGFCQLVLAVSGHRLWPDPTDLVALVAIGLSWHILARLALLPEPQRQVSERRNKALVFIGAVASVATSPSRPIDEPVSWAQPAEVYVLSNRGQSVQVRLSAPRDGVLFDCESAMKNPQSLFSESQFSVVNHVTLRHNDALPLLNPADRGSSACQVFLLAVEGSPQQIVAWRTGTFTVGNAVGQAGGRILILQTELNAPDGLLWPAPTESATPTTAACAGSDPGTEPTWSLIVPQSGPYTLRSVSKGGDGCSVLTLLKGSVETRFTVCSDPVDLPFVAGDAVSFRGTADGSDGLVIEGQSAGKTVTMTLVRRAYDLPAVSLTPACSPVRRACGAGEAVAMSVPTVLGSSRPLSRGEADVQSSGSTQVRVTMLRAENVRLTDSACDAQEALGPVGSYITVTTR